MTKNIELLNKLPINWKTINTQLISRGTTSPQGVNPLHCILEFMKYNKAEDFKSGCFANEGEWNFMFNKMGTEIENVIKLKSIKDPFKLDQNTLTKIANILEHKSDYLMSDSDKAAIEIKELEKEVILQEINAVELKETDKLHALIEKNQEAETIEIKKIYEVIAKIEGMRMKSDNEAEIATKELINGRISELSGQFQNFSEVWKLEIKRLNDTIVDMTQKTTVLEKYNEVLENRLVKVEGYEGRIAVIESTISSFYDMYTSIRDVLTCNSCTLDDYMLIGNNAVLYVDNHEIVS